MAKEKTLAEITCVAPEIKELILKRFKHDRKFNPDMDSLCNSLESASSCDSPTKTKTKVKQGAKKKTERNVYMGVCMRGNDKGGMGKDMKTCSENFKGMSNEEKNKYIPKEE